MASSELPRWRLTRVISSDQAQKLTAACPAYFTRLAFAPPKESPITPETSPESSSEKISQPYKILQTCIIPYQSLFMSYPPSSPFSLFQLFILLATSALGFLSMLLSYISEQRYSQTLVSPALFCTFDEGHTKTCCRF